MLNNNYTFQMRSKGVGVLSSSDAIRLGVVGPNLRASNVHADVRKDEPYEVYDRVDFDIPVLKEGDCFARALIRALEIEQSIRIVRQALKDMPEGPYKAKVPQSPPKGEAYSRVEAARGEFGYYLVSDGSPKPYRLKISSPSFRNLVALPFLCRNVPLADVPVVFITLDLIPLDVDR